jgi:PPOX class probable F420-dependent enzyme
MGTGWDIQFIESQRVGCLATVDGEGQPHVVPVVYAFMDGRIFIPVDEKSKRVEADRLKRIRNIQGNPHVTILVHKYSENWDNLAWVQIHGLAELISDGELYDRAMELLVTKYPQYRDMTIRGRPVISVAIRRILSWRA